MEIYEAFLNVYIFMYRLKGKIKALTEWRFNQLLSDSSITYEQKIYLIYFRYA